MRIAECGLIGLLATLLFTGPLPVLDARPAPAQVTGQVEPQQICMLNNFVIRTQQEGVPYVYQRKTYYFCCAGCIKRFATNPKEFSKAVDPVNEQDVDKAAALLYALDDTVYYFGSSKTMQTFADDPERYLRKAGSEEEPASRAEQHVGVQTAR